MILKFIIINLIISPLSGYASLVLILASDGDELVGLALLREFSYYFVLIQIMIFAEIKIIILIIKRIVNWYSSNL